MNDKSTELPQSRIVGGVIAKGGTVAESQSLIQKFSLRPIVAAPKGETKPIESETPDSDKPAGESKPK